MVWYVIVLIFNADFGYRGYPPFTTIIGNASCTSIKYFHSVLSWLILVLTKNEKIKTTSIFIVRYLFRWWSERHHTSQYFRRDIIIKHVQRCNVGELVWRLCRKIVDCVFILIKQFFQISRNRCTFLLMFQLDLLSFRVIIIRTIRVAGGSGKTKRHTNTALEATGQKKNIRGWHDLGRRNTTLGDVSNRKHEC